MSADFEVQPLSLILVPAAAVAAPLIADRLLRWIAVPTVVFEILLGVLIGPDVLNWVHVDDLIDALSQFGLAMLMFPALLRDRLRQTARRTAPPGGRRVADQRGGRARRGSGDQPETPGRRLHRAGADHHRARHRPADPA